MNDPDNEGKDKDWLYGVGKAPLHVRLLCWLIVAVVLAVLLAPAVLAVLR